MKNSGRRWRPVKGSATSLNTIAMLAEGSGFAELVAHVALAWAEHYLGESPAVGFSGHLFGAGRVGSAVAHG